jgi:hypothetical protein
MSVYKKLRVESHTQLFRRTVTINLWRLRHGYRNSFIKIPTYLIAYFKRPKQAAVEAAVVYGILESSRYAESRGHQSL